MKKGIIYTAVKGTPWTNFVGQKVIVRHAKFVSEEFVVTEVDISGLRKKPLSPIGTLFVIFKGEQYPQGIELKVTGPLLAGIGIFGNSSTIEIR